MSDAVISDITVILDKKYIDQPKTNEAVAALKSAGMDVRSVDEERSIVDGSINTRKLHDLETLDCVDYVRVTFTYEAEYPPGDPRDTDNAGGLE